MRIRHCFAASLHRGPWLAALWMLAGSVFAPDLRGADAPTGPLMIIGGGLRPDNAAIFRRLMEAAGGVESCRFVIFPTASRTTAGAERFKFALETCGVSPDRVSVVDIRLENAERSASDPTHVRAIAECTGAFFAGGDQGRIIAALRSPDGTDTPALAALRTAWRRGAVIAGSSAGAAMQSETMIAVSGLPDEALDEGMDALDFGLARDPRRRGLLVTRGLGFFQHGIIDQHFSQYRGRFARLARAAIGEKIRFGFGIDENTAMIVSAQGDIQVLGQGCLSVVDAAGAACDDGPLGCRIAGLRVSCLQSGDRFNLTTGEIAVHPAKAKIVPGSEPNRGNYLIADIAAEGAVRLALFSGLAENTSSRQSGITLRYAHSYGHGYRVVFRKTERTIAWRGVVDNVSSHAIQDVDVSIEPILSSLRPPEVAFPVDLLEGEATTACRALWFRGILLADDDRRLRPDAPITRAELAMALAHSVHLLPPMIASPAAPDVPEEAEWSEDVSKALEAKLLELNAGGLFRPEAPVSRQDAAFAFARLYDALHAGNDPSIEPITFQDETEILPRRREAVAVAANRMLLVADNGRFRPADPLLRSEAAQAIYRILGFVW